MPEHTVTFQEGEYQLIQEVLHLIRKYDDKVRTRTLERLLEEQESPSLPHLLSAEEDPWSNAEIEIPAGDSGLGDLASNHDHYLYGTPKKYPT